MAGRGEFLDDTAQAVDRIIARVGRKLVVGMPLGLGKPNHLVNALYRRVKADPSLHLKILTALTLEKPDPGHGIERAFMAPIVERLFGDYEELDYIVDLRRKQLPANVEVCEFFFRPGAFLGNAHAQQHYICSNYTHAARDVFAQGCNVCLQLVCKRVIDGRVRLSLSSNPDTSPELLGLMRDAERRGGPPCIAVAEVNDALPFMFHDAEVAPEEFDLVVDHPAQHTRLFGTPKDPVGTADYLIGLQASSLLRDGGTVQIGIGALGDAIVHAAILRQRDNATYREMLRACGILERGGAAIDEVGGTAPFERGLYGATEMFVDGFLHLYRAGVLKRRVYDFASLQRLLNDGQATDAVTPALLDAMEADGVRVLRTVDFEILQRHGVFADDCHYDHGHIVAGDGERIMANLAIPASRRALGAKCLGTRLRNGVVLHGAFFVGPNDFYQGLRDLPDAERRLLFMTGVRNINQLDEHPPLYRAQRVDARFINTGLMATCNGAVVSDGLEDGRVLSGVGGQYNFVAMAHQLPGGRSILMIRAVREADGKASSNILWNYGHCTIPRHLRDIVVTEYGIAMLRSQTDRDVIKAMLNLADSRFQEGLLAQSIKAGKVEAGYRIPELFRNNTPQRLEAAMAPLRARGLLPAFPFGTELTDQEIVLGRALKAVKARAARGRLRVVADALRAGPVPPGARPYLERVQLATPRTFADRVTQKLLVLELRAAGAL